MKHLLSIVLLMLAIQSCQTIRFLTARRVYFVPQSFNDTVSNSIQRLQSCKDCDYFIYKENFGSCIGGSLQATARIIWVSPEGITYSRSLMAKQRKITDKTSVENFEGLFRYFEENRIDTITTIPREGYIMDPISFCEMTVRRKGKIYQRTMEQTPFVTTTDTLHLVYILYKKSNPL